jgi:hypothetical protein
VRQANLLRRLPGLRGALRDGSTTTGHVASLGGEDGRPAPSTTGATTSSATVRRAKPSATVIIDFGSFSEARFWHDQLDAETIWDDPSYRSLASVRQDLLGTGHIPSRTASLLTCDANVRRHVLDPHGQPLNLGRSTPTVTSSQRHALVVRDRGCVFPTSIGLHNGPTHITSTHGRLMASPTSTTSSCYAATTIDSFTDPNGASSAIPSRVTSQLCGGTDGCTSEIMTASSAPIGSHRPCAFVGPHCVGQSV